MNFYAIHDDVCPGPSHSRNRTLNGVAGAIFPTLGARFGVGSGANVSMSDGGLVPGGFASGPR